jgi:hypothetical protein
MNGYELLIFLCRQSESDCDRSLAAKTGLCLPGRNTLNASLLDASLDCRARKLYALLSKRSRQKAIETFTCGQLKT